ncbi:MAG: hypothetical protein R3C02_04770 [Planctomycetaceae bacterium]
MFISSTYWNRRRSVCVLPSRHYEVARRNVPEQLDQLGTTIQSQLNATAEETVLPFNVVESVFIHRLSFDCQRGRHSLRQVSTLYIQEMAKRGCHEFSRSTSTPLSPAEVKQTVEAANDVFAIITDALVKGDVKQRWNVNSSKTCSTTCLLNCEST